ncbi:MAG: CoA transferase, partial [Chloroflexi bacterium]|nr:CoA transferase [Chloroflexota bacterium]
LLLEMAPHYDVFVENYSPGVMERLGLTYDVLKQVQPSIIYARIKGFGLTGPYSQFKCFDPIAQNAAGAFSTTGEANGPPMMPKAAVGDSGTGMQMAFAIAAAYIQRLRTGAGQQIEISMQEAMTYYMRTYVSQTEGWGESVVPRNGNGFGFSASDLYPCKPAPGSNGANDYVYIILTTSRMWDTLCTAMDRPELTVDPRFAEDAGRVEHQEALKQEIRSWTMQRTKWEAQDILAEAGVPCSATHDTYDLFHNPHFEERGFIQHLDHPEWGPIRQLGWAPRLSGSDVAMKAAPLLGQHTSEVLCDDLGINPDEFAKLQADGVVAAHRNGD